MADCMAFPETFDEFAKVFGFIDSKEYYTNGAELIPVFRVKQWLENESARQKAEKESLVAELERFKKIETAVNGLWDEIPKLAMVKNKKYPTLEELLEYIENLKNEAIKEFAERLKEQKYQSSDWSHGEHPFVVEESDIDNVLFEMGVIE